MGLLLLRKGSQSYIGLVFTPFDPPTRVVIVKRKCVRLHANTRLGGGGGGYGPLGPSPGSALKLTEVMIYHKSRFCRCTGTLKKYYRKTQLEFFLISNAE